MDITTGNGGGRIVVVLVLGFLLALAALNWAVEGASWALAGLVR